jgi:hypothetical protein
MCQTTANSPSEPERGHSQERRRRVPGARTLDGMLAWRLLATGLAFHFQSFGTKLKLIANLGFGDLPGTVNGDFFTVLVTVLDLVERLVMFAFLPQRHKIRLWWKENLRSF